MLLMNVRTRWLGPDIPNDRRRTRANSTRRSSRAISHPLRHRLLGMLDGRIASPNELARELGLPLGRVSYHIRLLNDLGAIELVRTEPRRGALEHFYSAVTRVWFSEGDWAKLPRSARRGILGQNLQQIFTDVTAAADAGGFDHPASRPARAARARRRRAWTRSPGCCATRSTARARSTPSTARARAAPTEPPSDRALDPACSSAARKLDAYGRASDARSSRRRRRWRWPTRRSSRWRCRRSSPRWTPRSPASPRSSASTRSCSRWRSCPAARLIRRRAPAGLARCSRVASLGLRRSRARSALLLVFRALQAAGGAAALLAAFEMLDAGESRTGRRLWLGAALAGTAAGPAIGGALTEAFDWRAIFFVQARAAVAACARREPQGAATRLAPDATPVDGSERRPGAGDVPPRHEPAAPPVGRGRRPHASRRLARLAARWLAALAFTAAAFTAVLFLLVLELVAGLRALAAAGRARRHGAADRRARRRGDPAASRGRARWPARCCWPAAPRRSPSCPGRRSPGRSCRRCWPAPGWASRCPRFAGELRRRRRRRGRSSPATSASSSCSRSSRPWPRTSCTSETDKRVLQGAALVLDAQLDPLDKLELAPGCSTASTPSARAPACRTRVDRRARRLRRRRRRLRPARRRGSTTSWSCAVQDAFRTAYLIAARARAARRRAAGPAWRRPAVWLRPPRRPRCVAVYAVEARPPGAARGRPRKTPASRARCRQRRHRRRAAGAGAQAARPRGLPGGLHARGAGAGASPTPSARTPYQREYGVNPRNVLTCSALLGGAERQPPPRRSPRWTARTPRPSSAASAARSIGASGSVASTTSVSPGRQRGAAPGGRG